MECLRLRVKDIDLARGEIVVREGKGGGDRISVFPQALTAPLTAHLQRVHTLHQRDLTAGLARVMLPGALACKYPAADRDWAWQWIFPAASISTDPRTGARRRHHVHATVPQRAIRAARHAAGIAKPVGPHTLDTASPPTCSRTATTS